MNVLGITLLNELKKVSGFENAIIAGGFCRDYILGAHFNDIDVFIPQNRVGFRRFVENLPMIKGLSHYAFRDDHSYGRSIKGNHVTGVLDAKFMNNIDVQIIGHSWNEEDNFPTEVMKYFDYGINKVYYDGHAMIETPHFEFDARNDVATLRYIPDIANLPRLMERFNNLKAKYPHLSFNSTALEVKRE